MPQPGAHVRTAGWRHFFPTYLNPSITTMRRTALRLSSWNNLDGAGEPLTCERAHPSIERRDNALAAMCERQEIRVRELPITLQSSLYSLYGSRDLYAVRPKVVTSMTEVLVEKRQCFDGRKGVSREGGIRNNSNQSKLGKRTRRPARVRTSGKPAMRHIMVLVSRPQQRGQNIHVKQCRLHGTSSRNSSTSAAVTLGDCRLRRTTRRPLRCSVTSGRSAAFLTKALTA